MHNKNYYGPGVCIYNSAHSQAAEIQYLNPLPCLEKLLLKGNPLASSLSYRSQVFGYLSKFAEQVRDYAWGYIIDHGWCVTLLREVPDSSMSNIILHMCICRSGDTC